jgi:hypothetical protein
VRDITLLPTPFGNAHCLSGRAAGRFCDTCQCLPPSGIVVKMISPALSIAFHLD